MERMLEKCRLKTYNKFRVKKIIHIRNQLLNNYKIDEKIAENSKFTQNYSKEDLIKWKDLVENVKNQGFLKPHFLWDIMFV